MMHERLVCRQQGAPRCFPFWRALRLCLLWHPCARVYRSPPVFHPAVVSAFRKCMAARSISGDCVEQWVAGPFVSFDRWCRFNRKDYSFRIPKDAALPPSSVAPPTRPALRSLGDRCSVDANVRRSSASSDLRLRRAGDWPRRRRWRGPRALGHGPRPLGEALATHSGAGWSPSESDVSAGGRWLLAAKPTQQERLSLHSCC